MDECGMHTIKTSGNLALAAGCAAHIQIYLRLNSYDSNLLVTLNFQRLNIQVEIINTIWK